MAEKMSVAPVFVLIICFAVPAALFFWLSRNAPLKRKLFPFVLLPPFLAFMLIPLRPGPLAFRLLFGAALIYIYWSHLRCTQFCDACGRTVYSRNPFTPARYCQYCGAELHKT
ncbi:MAG TPA: hypothetical protein VIT92_12230 [Burkholderiaceae bacterium]